MNKYLIICILFSIGCTKQLVEPTTSTNVDSDLSDNLNIPVFPSASNFQELYYNSDRSNSMSNARGMYISERAHKLIPDNNLAMMIGNDLAVIVGDSVYAMTYEGTLVSESVIKRK